MKIPLIALLASLSLGLTLAPAKAENPIIKDRFTADPAALVYQDKVYLYTGHDEAPADGKSFLMKDWRCYSSSDMVNWKDEGSPLSTKAFEWAARDAWAGQVIERGGKFYWYVTVSHKTILGFSIGVGVSDSPTGPFKDARGSALVTNGMTKFTNISWDDIDPTVWIDDDGQAYLFWGNTKCHYAKLKSNMTEIDGPIVNLELPKFTEAPWIHKRNGLYYLSYAYGFPEQIAYATADKITGPYTFRNVINGVIPNSPTNHQSIIEFKGKSYFFYHNAALPGGGEFHRSVCVEELFYNPNGTIRPITQSAAGVGQPVQQGTTAAPQADVPKFITTKSGLKYQDLVVGEGKKTVAMQQVTVNYRGTLENGNVFDQSYGRAPFSFLLGGGQVIKGWDEGVQGMKIGGKRKLIIPPSLGYGASGAGGVIPPNATLTFEVELLKVG